MAVLALNSKPNLVLFKLWKWVNCTNQITPLFYKNSKVVQGLLSWNDLLLQRKLDKRVIKRYVINHFWRKVLLKILLLNVQIKSIKLIPHLLAITLPQIKKSSFRDASVPHDHNTLNIQKQTHVLATSYHVQRHSLSSALKLLHRIPHKYQLIWPEVLVI